MSEMKPCPFCGCDKIYADSATGSPCAWCPDCRAEGPVRKTTAEAIAAWNTRADDWRGMDSAPRDGTDILVCGPKRGGGRYITTTGWPPGWSGKWPVVYMDYAEDEPTHWRPLPAPPVEGE